MRIRLKILTKPSISHVSVCSPFLEEANKSCKTTRWQLQLLRQEFVVRASPGLRTHLVRTDGRVYEKAVVKSDQDREIFYKAVNNYFESAEIAYYPSRTVKSIKRRAKKVLLESLRFASCKAKVTNVQLTRTNKKTI